MLTLTSELKHCISG